MPKQTVKLVSWNVNGYRAVMKKEFLKSVRDLDVDILGLQETKLQENQLTRAMKTIDGYDAAFSFSTVKKGYSGVATYSRLTPKAVRHGIGVPRFDDEGRIIELEFDDFSLFNVYFPNGQMNDARLQYKLDFYEAFFAYTERLRQQGRSLIITGDFNTAHNEIDLKNPGPNSTRSGFLPIERQWIDRIVAMGYVDTFRHLYPDTIKYSWWTYRFKARENNAGWRIDYFFVSEDMIRKGWVKDAFIDNTVFGSDHCPVGLVLEI
ncbi:Exodeoxyribonuclease [Desulfosarcina cetonica]|uniref:exodeoxyribonuclease III n=1 Tax=Desulfosarcina cetonica TaxID=90730 RepID=UPI0006CF90B1|nr:exodeoxyribonuclease III [Desulfosarcina cetonica]VTR64051.1 Exodeoxyribonuclease [Desulfosarcina cetonica]